MDKKLPKTLRQGKPDSGDGNQLTVDVIGMLRRRMGLFLLTLLISSLLGVLHFCKAPRTFESAAKILVEAKRSPSFSAQSIQDRSIETKKSVETHAQIASSPRIISRALSKLEDEGIELPSLKDATSPVDFIISNLTVFEQADGSSVITLAYRGSDAEDCYEIVNSILESYQEFLGETDRGGIAETTELITSGKDELLVSLKEKEEAYNKFRLTAPLLWDNGRGINIHQQRQIQIENSRTELLIQRAQVDSKLRSINESLNSLQPQNRDVLLFEAMRELLVNNSDTRVNEQVMDRETLRQMAADYASLVSQESQLKEEFAEGHPDLISLRKRITELQNRMFATQAKLLPSTGQAADGLSVDYVDLYLRKLKDEIASLDEQLLTLEKMFNEEQKKANDLQEFLVKDDELFQDKERTQQLFDSVKARLDEINILRDHGGDRISMLADPVLGRRVSPNLIRSLAGSLLLGMLLGMGLVYLVDKSESTFRDPTEISRALSLPVIGQIPQLRERRNVAVEPFAKMSPTLVSVHRQQSNVAEAIRAVRTSLFFSTAGEQHQVIQVTSPMPSDGKSTLTANLAVTIAKSGKRVLIIDADFRRPTVHKLFGLQDSNEAGLAQVVLGEEEASDVTQTTGIENLYVMTAGARPHNPAELLTSSKFQNVVEMLRERYDFVLIDSPPLLAVTDPVAIAARVDGTILALRIRPGVQMAALKAKELLDNVDANILGVVVNAVAEFGWGKRYNYGYKYGYGYTSEEYGTPVTKRNAARQSRRLETSSAKR